jgi:DNA-binding PadR family transcriptional regulator
MRYDDEHSRRSRPDGPGRGRDRWEPADDGERRRWHDDKEERRGRGRGRHGHFAGPFPGGEFPGPAFERKMGRGGFPGPGFPGGPEMEHLGPWMHGGRGGRGMRGPRARRGDVRAAALALLAEAPMNGYQIIQEISERSGGVWRPSPGSVYPALQQLEDEGLIRAEAGEGGRRAFQLTDEGQAYASSHAEELRAPWDVVAGSAGGAALEMRKLIGQVAMAAFQVISAGTDAQAAQARQLLTDTRKALYRILAADDDASTAGSGDAE